MKSNFWKKLKKPVMVMAPMSGVTDEPFRFMFLKYGKPDVFWTEFVSADGLISPKGRKYCLSLLKFNKKERPIVAQIFGANPDNFEKVGVLIAELGFDGIDINMGCPDRDIEKQGAGAALINNPNLAKEIIRAVKKGAPQIPISVKTRIGYNKNQIDEWIKAILEENISALVIHLRTRKEMYLGTAHWELAEKIVKLRDKYSPETLIIGNGDVKSLDEAKKLAKETGLDGIMIGRAILGNPWFFSNKIPSLSKRLNAIVEHAEIFDNSHKEDINNKKYYKKFASIKKHFHAYTKNFRGAKDLRDNLMKVKNTSETKKVIEDFKKYFLILIFSIFFTMPFLCMATQPNMEKIFYMNQTGEAKGIISLQENADKIDILAPQFFAVTSKMKITGGFDKNLKKIIADKKMKVMPLIVNASFNQKTMHKLLLSKNDQDAVIQGLIYIAKKNKYIGWQFDFENISYLDKDLYSVFVEKTVKAFHKKGLILSVAAVTRTTDFEDTDAYKNWGGAYDYARLAKAVDFISLMTYDDPNSVGPVASIPFINGVLAYVKDKIPPEKLSLGIPFYYWKWNADTNKKVGSGLFDNVLAIIGSYSHNLTFDQNLGVACLSYSYNQNNYKIWFEDKDSVLAKLDVVKANNFRGFSAWVLGGEDPAIWTILQKNK